MCGIACIVTKTSLDNTILCLRRMAKSLSHKGSDDEGFYEKNTKDAKYTIGLAHRRLSIIDLSSGK